MTAAWAEDEHGRLARAGGCSVLRSAPDDLWFYVCLVCECEFGLLVDLNTAKADAVSHDYQWHNGQAVAQ